MPEEERILIALLVLIGGARFLVAITTGRPLDAEPTIGLMMFVAGLWWGLRAFRVRRESSGKSHDANRTDRARDTMGP